MNQMISTNFKESISDDIFFYCDRLLIFIVLNKGHAHNLIEGIK